VKLGPGPFSGLFISREYLAKGAESDMTSREKFLLVFFAHVLVLFLFMLCYPSKNKEEVTCIN